MRVLAFWKQYIYMYMVRRVGEEREREEEGKEREGRGERGGNKENGLVEELNAGARKRGCQG